MFHQMITAYSIAKLLQQVKEDSALNLDRNNHVKRRKVLSLIAFFAEELKQVSHREVFLILRCLKLILSVLRKKIGKLDNLKLFLELDLRNRSNLKKTLSLSRNSWRKWKGLNTFKITSG